MNFKSTESLFSRIRENLSSYSSAGVMDVGKFYFEVKWFIQHLGIEMYELDEDVLHLVNHRAEMPCNFYLLEGAYLCHGKHEAKSIDNFQGKTVIYTEKTCEKVVEASCNSSCGEKVLDKITTKEYVNTGDAYNYTWHTPVLMTLGNKLTKQVCAKDCKNLFCTTGSDISILRQGQSHYLVSSLKDPTIYIRYYSYPVDELTGLPLIPDEPIIEKALENHLMFYFFKNLWLNGDDPNVQQKISFLKVEANESMAEAEYYSKLPTFNAMVQLTRRNRKRNATYEVMNTRHF